MFHFDKTEVRHFRLYNGKLRLALSESYSREGSFLGVDDIAFLDITKTQTLEAVITASPETPFLGMPELRLFKRNPSLLPNSYFRTYRVGTPFMYFLGSRYQDTLGNKYIPYLVETNRDRWSLGFVKTTVYISGVISPAIPFYV
jgi:hypothetical protein